MKTSPMPVVIMVPWQHPADCAVAALAMACGVAYTDAALAFGDARVLRGGAWMSQIVRAAAALGVPLTKRPAGSWDAETADGIVQVRLPKSPQHHVALLREGLLFDTDLAVWEPSDYLAVRKGRWGWLLTRRDA